MNNERCVLLPHNIGDGVIKIQLDNNSSETARVILFVPPNSCIYNHSHEKNENPDSEVYIDLLERLKASKDSILPEVAGSNSPTGRTIHSIEKKDYPQIILAIKKGQEEGEWEEFKTNFKEYFQSLGVTYLQNGDTIKITSNGTGENEEVVIINLRTNSVAYSSSKKQQEFVTLYELQNLPKPKDEETKSKD